MSRLNDKSDWMGESNVLNLTIKEICLAGSHNCFSYNTKTQIKAAEPYDSFPIIMNGFVKDWSETQTLTILQQLQEGVRYFDLRIQKFKDDIYTVHGLYCDLFVVILTQLSEFIWYHKKEVIILDINHIYNMNKEDNEKILEIISCLFNGISVECNPNNLNIPLEVLVSNNKRVFIFYDYPKEVKRFPYVWGQDFIHSYWPDRPTFQEVSQRILTDGMNWINNRRTGITILQIILTPTNKSIKSCYLSVSNSKSLKGVSYKVKENFFQFLHSKELESFPINILLLDFIQINDPFIQLCIERSIKASNEKRGH
ncbi:glycosylphosphatidylinositol diacylglycerol-lyase, putative [Entamoeba histolytica HM-1:IMSS-B]|uniref:Phosphatidylinositol-specific phospholipase C X domain-containing protein n=6 Tax=Entamoeba histolytica TaxID=5759 RepID=C4LVJ3_ENTH1|nr:hypothetical protein, conserved [Entamoeba histolytica HM-1:IMSS]EMD48725.1 phosphatidylinositol specific phospholipase X domain containing protein [Entamoeba histolytica KU27]EMH76985.1 glycosylphosphatidylinositol diacylglycerol-lyase, putative [Entamoeba histolytica HM-1:IMSS-B]EMS13420.1 phosphatidylinositol-specific phospholipase C X domain containing protein [Entamoeba histolytica HM-3:IMSS]ENY64840.1 phosphatidylinositol-specific phospholipase C X domain containing protein [Entamoeba |eukprot:XP_652415.1 hypothetical protein, conserved [Entamoeba histolytica HM-1:IMSS]